VRVTEFELNRPILLEGRAHEDVRGIFMETYRQDQSPVLPNNRGWVQDNMSRSRKAGTVRGLHWQISPNPQDKLVSVLKGAILDVVVDLRINSQTFGECTTFNLTENTNQKLLIPVGFGHGFCTLSEDTIVAYKCSAYYDAKAERSLLWCDPCLDVSWPVCPQHAIVSEKDQLAPLLSQLAKQDLFNL
jgi:dTDP-4-dehydrorhamnose 3,5-epimerase